MTEIELIDEWKGNFAEPYSNIAYEFLAKVIEQYVTKARIEEHEKLKYSSCPHIDSAERLEYLKKKLQGDKEE